MMNFFSSSLIGFFFGVFFGAGCALAVMYAIYSGGYRRGITDSLRPEKSDLYRRWLPHAEKQLAKERNKAGK
ncbi:hypothetical protein [Silvibacterium acidisoli]|uniref:hypothetical protein n=1 Tax=Acidobacteriaceae bacterium ZG23-2 TaxID=2883246 RepID=UPI00406C327C